MSIFNKTDEFTQAPPRNTFDGSFANNLTLKPGVITPCFCKEVLPGDSFKIDPKFGFSFMPMVFPVQTNMTANMHFFYVRNRALWKGWENFITKTENLEGDSTPPYIMLTSENRDMFDTGNIGDYLGVPTVFYGTENEKKVVPLSAKNLPSITQGFYLHTPDYSTESGTDYFSLFNGSFSDSKGTAQTITRVLTSLGTTYDEVNVRNLNKFQDNTLVPSLQNGTNGFSPLAIGFLPPNTSKVPFKSGNAVYQLLNNEFIKSNTRLIYGVFDVTIQQVVSYAILQFTDSSQTNWLSTYNIQNIDSDTYFLIPATSDVHQYLQFAFTENSIPAGQRFDISNASLDSVVTFDARHGIPNFMRELYDLPFVSSTLGPSNQSGEIRISAMPFRAVEACYNSFYRDDRNNPLIIDGKPYYNIWVQNRDGGADTTHYKLYRKNWQSDVFTTAVQSPQQGVLPLVGVSVTGNMEFQDETGKSYYLQAELDDDGHTITGIKSYSSDMPTGTLRAMVDTISTGISINDFRNVNALQRWLETNMRKGLRYKDQIEAHFGTSPTYSELQMPEFIGGMSRGVAMSAIEQSVDTLDPATGKGNALGTLGGRASVMGNGKPITHYCDEHGWIIGFITITPTPVYSQQLNKQLLKTELLDYYFPEFAHIGFQPILNRELAPLQCKSGQQPNGDGLMDVFGYQRAWYEYLENVDEVHGDFRTNLRNFLIQRTFNGVPKLSPEFLLVGEKEVNEVYAVQDDSDKIFGQIYFDVKMKRPIPRLGIPKLEVG